jgi:hypothetical protein
MAERTYIDCREIPSEMHCSLTIVGQAEEVLKASAEHAVSTHGHQDGPELREALRSAMKPVPATGIS